MKFREEQEVVITSSGSGGPLASELEVRPASSHQTKPFFSRLFKVKELIEASCDP